MGVDAGHEMQSRASGRIGNRFIQQSRPEIGASDADVHHIAQRMSVSETLGQQTLDPTLDPRARVKRCGLRGSDRPFLNIVAARSDRVMQGWPRLGVVQGFALGQGPTPAIQINRLGQGQQFVEGSSVEQLTGEVGVDGADTQTQLLATLRV